MCITNRPGQSQLTSESSDKNYIIIAVDERFDIHNFVAQRLFTNVSLDDSILNV